MTIKFNENKEFPLNGMSEMHNVTSSVPDLLVCTLPYSESINVEIINFLNNNIINKIEVYNNIGTKIYTTTTLVNYLRLHKMFTNEGISSIQLNFGL